MTNIRVSQEALEILLRRNPNLRISQLSMEALVSLANYSNIRVSQYSVEILGSTSVSPTGERTLGPPVQVI
jgi:hypothetical protein